jgi:uncharacterized protein YkwD
MFAAAGPAAASSRPSAATSSPARAGIATRRHLRHGRRPGPDAVGCANGSTRPGKARRACRKQARDSSPSAPQSKGRPKQPRVPKHVRVSAPHSSTPPSTANPEAAPSPSTVRGAAQAVAASIATVLATPCENTELTPDAENIGLVRASVLCLINRKRAENGETPLTVSPQLEAAAEGHCQELILDDYFAHVSPSGVTPVDRIRTTGYIPGPSVGYVIGENLAWGTYQLSTPQSIVAAWIASPGHLANILEAQYRETGIGVSPSVPVSLAGGSPGATYAQEFGVIIH